MRSSRLFWKLFLVYVVLNLTLALAFLIVVSRRQHEQALHQIEHRLHDLATVLQSHVAERLERGEAESIQALFTGLAAETGTRLTLVDLDGVVLADSDKDPSKMENHRNRPELVAAAAGRVGTSQRVSPTLDIPMYYLAVPVGRSGAPEALVRVAMPVRSINVEIAAIQRLLWPLAGSVALLAAALTYLVVRRIVGPLSALTRAAEAVERGDAPPRIAADTGDELGTLGAAFNRMQDELAARIQQLQRRGERLETVLRSMVEGVIVVDADQNIVLANLASQRLQVLSGPDVVGRPLQEVTRSPLVDDAVKQALAADGPQVSELELPGRKSRILALRAVRLPGNPCPGAVAVLRDLTELRALENLRREFVANVSHELKTPLSAIKAYAETLRLGAVHDEQHNLDFVKQIEQQAERLHQLILDLLALARVEAGREKMDLGDVPLAGLVAACVAEHQGAAESKRITLRALPPDHAAVVRGEEEALQTILNNLLDNAINYTPEQGSVTIRWQLEVDAAVLEVEDTGIGIAAKDQARVFERFYRVDKARSRELGGTGLGLAIVKHLVQALGGSLHLTSAIGAGSTFAVRLPLAGVRSGAPV